MNNQTILKLLKEIREEYLWSSDIDFFSADTVDKIDKLIKYFENDTD